jgi:hypothetical protein
VEYVSPASQVIPSSFPLPSDLPAVNYISAKVHPIHTTMKLSPFYLVALVAVPALTYKIPIKNVLKTITIEDETECLNLCLPRNTLKCPKA